MAVPVAISEVLEVRGGPLAEDELWAVLAASSRPLKDLLASAKSSSVAECSICSDTLFLRPEGALEMKMVHKSGLLPPFLPPEYVETADEGDDSDHFRPTQPTAFDLDAMEKAVIHSLGAILVYGLNYEGSTEAPSSQLLSLLNVMTVKDPKTRPTLARLSQMATNSVSERGVDPPTVVKALYEELMGSTEDLSSITPTQSSPEPPVITNSTPKDHNANEPPSSERRRTEEARERELGSSPIGSPIGHSTRVADAADSTWAAFDDSPEKNTSSMYPDDGDSSNEEIERFHEPAKEEPQPTKEPKPSKEEPTANVSAPADPFREEEEEFPSSDPFAEHKDDSAAFPDINTPHQLGCDHASARAGHSLNCQFCSPRALLELGRLEDNRKASLPNLKSDSSTPVNGSPKPAVRLYTPKSERRRHDKDAPKEQSNLEKNPFEGFDDLSEGKPVPKRRQGSNSSSSSSSSASSERVPVPAPRKSKESSPTHSLRSKEEKAAAEEEAQLREEAGSPVAEEGEYSPAKEHHRPLTPPPAPRTPSPERADSAGGFARKGSLVSSKIARRGSRSSTGSRRPTSSNSPTGAAGAYREVAVDDGAAYRPNGSARTRRSQALPSMPEKVAPPIPPQHGNCPLQVIFGPEFVYKSRQPAIRVKAPLRKKTGLMSKPEPASVVVELLSGQRVDVACRSDSTAGDIFDAVVSHQSLPEHSLHGLTLLQDGEHYFLDPERKLIKSAPPGWGRNRKAGLAARNLYTLFLRLRYYPTDLDFVNTPKTLHEIYLQLRRDFAQEERLQTDREHAFQLAALMLQAEYGDQATPSSDDPSSSNSYFQLDHYLPNRHMMTEMGAEDRVRTVLAEMHHSHYAGLSQEDAEVEFIRLCQAEAEYGIHFYRLYKSKPSLNLVPTPLGDPDTGTLLWVGITNTGLGIFEDRAGERKLQDPQHWHEWLKTQSIKFDRKRFVIIPTAPDEDAAKKSAQTYYTDSNKKSTYFVRFAMSQHRFSMRMRSWTATIDKRTQSREGSRLPSAAVAHNPHSLSNKSSDSGVPDLGGSREASPDEKIAALAARNGHSPVAPPRKNTDSNGVVTNGNGRSVAVSVEEPSRDQTFFETTNTSASDSLQNRLDSASEPPFREFEVKLLKDPQYGLGLTLVDGNIQGMRGVFVKSLTEGGPAKTQGRMKIGDMIKAINGTSLDGRNRHDAVDLVKASPPSGLTMWIRRIGDLERGSSAESLEAAMPVYRSQDIETALVAELNKAPAEPTIPEETLAVPKAPQRKRNDSSIGTGSTRSSKSTGSSGEFRLHGEAEADPAAPITPPDRKALAQQPKSSASLPAYMSQDTSHHYAGLHDSDSDESTMARSVDRRNTNRTTEDSDDEPRIDARGKSATLPPTFNSSMIAEQEPRSSYGNSSESMGSGRRPRNVSNDWVDGISFDERGEEEDEEVEEIQVRMDKENGSLGLKIAGGSKGQSRIYIKALLGNPALSCPNLRPGDRLVSVNGTSTESATHQEVVELLKAADSPVSLGLTRPLATPTASPSKERDDIVVELEKPASGSLGLSLARPTGGEGIYVRVITPASPADVDGRLRVGDRLWKINDDSVADASPLEVVEKLKAANGVVRLTVKRA